MFIKCAQLDFWLCWRCERRDSWSLATTFARQIDVTFTHTFMCKAGIRRGVRDHGRRRCYSLQCCSWIIQAPASPQCRIHQHIPLKLCMLCMFSQRSQSELWVFWHICFFFFTHNVHRATLKHSHTLKDTCQTEHWSSAWREKVENVSLSVRVCLCLSMLDCLSVWWVSERFTVAL